ncbi:MAG TPA: hypothetical protein VHN15_00025 [Thermoanaerobaculia bacterium]|nr:hypothetical protein [Thermoanaerobaculia bacterium]
MREKPVLTRSFPTLVVLSLLALAPAGCGGPADPPGQAAAAASRSASAEAEWEWLTKTRAALDQKRVQLAQLRGSSQRAQAGEKPDPQAVQKEAELRKEVEALSLELGRRLVDFINSDPPLAGEPLSERQKAALRMKSDEDIALARDYVERGGDYRRAIEIYEAALVVDPDYDRLRQELERARAERYMTRERFDQVKEGMSDAEVRALLGQPNLHNVREYKDKGVLAWFYPRDASGAAAAVFFKKEGEQLEAYAMSFEALPKDLRGPRAPAPRGPQRRPAAPAAPGAAPAPAPQT